MKDANALDGGSPKVGLVIKITVMDAPFLEVMVPHMVSQSRFPFWERTIVVDRQPRFTGKYRTRPRANHAVLDRILGRLLEAGVVDRILDVDLRPSKIQAIMERYFARDADRVATHCSIGTPIYATLFGLESMATDYVLQTDADIYFHTGPESWVRQALICLVRDSHIWLMMTHPGPPAGSPGKSLGSCNARRATWDQELGIWRFRHATSRYFLCDRRKLYSQLFPIIRGKQSAPLEQCITAALQRRGAFRGNLGNLQSWHLHAWYHAAPFPQWAAALAKAVEGGYFPPLQRGQYDLRLDRERDRREWWKLLTTEHNRGSISFSSHSVAPVNVIIPVRDRAGQRLRNVLRSLNWQSVGRPSQVLVVSHGSQPAVDRELSVICFEESATLITIGDPNEPWNKPLALNTGIRATFSEIPFVMTLDADVILDPGFLKVALERLKRKPPALILCRISDLPQHASVPRDRQALINAFADLKTLTRLRPRYGTGAVQATRRCFFFDIRGYDEDLLWWGAMDGDLVNRARLAGLEIVWVDKQTTLLHQWHPRKHAVLNSPEEIEQAKHAWKLNHAIVRSRSDIIQRNPDGWGGVRE